MIRYIMLAAVVLFTLRAPSSPGGNLCMMCSNTGTDRNGAPCSVYKKNSR